jgi:hypothetical protein
MMACGPLCGNPHGGKPHAGKPHAGNPPCGKPHSALVRRVARAARIG